jgi:hypothetical protein
MDERDKAIPSHLETTPVRDRRAVAAADLTEADRAFIVAHGPTPAEVENGQWRA